MSKLSSFLWRLFCTLAVFFYHMERDANAKAGDISIKTICDSNQYVKSCGDYAIGNNWLKGGTAYGLTSTVRIPVYYNESDYTGETEPPTTDYLSRSFKYFLGRAYQASAFTENPDLGTYDSAYNNTHGALTDVLQSLTNDPADTANSANTLLTLLCDPTISGNVQCEQCPGDGKVDASSVGVIQDFDDNYDSYSIIAKTWKIYTISDCYMNEFTDSFGVFQYVNNERVQSCYYNYTKNDVNGTNFSQ